MNPERDIQGAVQGTIGGFFFGVGLVLAALVMRALFHVGMCG